MNQEDQDKNEEILDDEAKFIADAMKQSFKADDSDDLWNLISERLDDDFQEVKAEKETIKKEVDQREKRLAKVYHLPEFRARKLEKEKLEIFHEEILAEETGELSSIEDRYWLGLSEYIDNECAPSKQRKITEHLLECSLCRERFNSLTDLNEVIKEKVLRKDSNYPSKDEFWNEMEKIIDQEEVKTVKVFPYKKAAVAAMLLVAVGLGGIARFKYKEEYNYVLTPEDGAVKWNRLGLTNEQATKLDKIDKAWKSFKNEQEGFVDKRKMLLDREMSKKEPNLRLIDKYQREILDHEILLKREEANFFMEKRFLLSEKQTLKLLQQMQN